MEPGLRDREYGSATGNTDTSLDDIRALAQLQWSPVLETGNTAQGKCGRLRIRRAAMEPGLRDREYRTHTHARTHAHTAAMEPGLRDREYEPTLHYPGNTSCASCNGARS